MRTPQYQPSWILQAFAVWLGLVFSGPNAFADLVAIAPAVRDRGGRIPAMGSGWVLLVAVFLAGMLSSVVATKAALRSPLLKALREE